MTTVGILGTLHDEQMRIDYNYSLDYMRELVMEFKPDIILGEVRPQDWEAYKADKEYDGYLGPHENRNLLIPLCEENNIEFIPVDWFEYDIIPGDDYYHGKTKSEIDEYNAGFEKIMVKYFELAKSSTIPFNSHEFNQLIEEKQEYQRLFSPDFEKIIWEMRNELMVFRIKKALRNNEGKRILCTAGAEHNYYYLKELSKIDGIEVQFPIR